MTGAAAISAVVDCLTPEDLELLLTQRGLPAGGTSDELYESLKAHLRTEMCTWELERGECPGYHCGKAPLLALEACPEEVWRLSVLCLQKLLLLVRLWRRTTTASMSLAVWTSSAARQITCGAGT